MMPEDSTTSPSAVVDLAGLVEVQAERIKKLEADLATAQEALRLDRHRCSSVPPFLSRYRNTNSIYCR